MFIIKFLIYFSISFLVLSIPVKEKQLFYYLSEMTTSYTHPGFKKVESLVKEQLSKKKIMGLQIIDSAPKNPMKKLRANPAPPTLIPNKKEVGPSLQLDKKSELTERERYSETELRQLRELLKNSDI